jgi:GDP/UDP-N,N'-diacetylbacillosamine 2-epimerase (hydrolysing)
MKTIGILTSSRADYGIYLPLLKTLKEDPDFNLKLIVFGTHLSPFHGYTINQILEDGFKVDYKIESMLIGDSPNAISTAMALTSIKFADFWEIHKNDFDLVFCLGDRYEMFSAVIAGIPFGIRYAHLHGGEKTIGATDNIFRHSITLASKYHFVSCEGHAKRVAELIESDDRIYNVGSLSLDSLKSLPLYSISEFHHVFHIDLSRPTILVTVHPETVNIENNQIYIDELTGALKELTDYQIIITLPNADTNSTIIRNKFLQLANDQNNRVLCIENLGSKGYFSAMKYCSFLVGNSSSGIIEAASFNKWVINLGDRQKGRYHSDNVLNAPFNNKIIISIISKIEPSLFYSGENIYYQEDVSKKICSILKNIL